MAKNFSNYLQASCTQITEIHGLGCALRGIYNRGPTYTLLPYKTLISHTYESHTPFFLLNFVNYFANYIELIYKFSKKKFFFILTNK